MTDVILALDLGTSSIKALCVDRYGVEMDRERTPHTTMSASSNAAEQDPVAWWEHTREIISTLTNDAIEPVNIVAIALTGQMHGLVLRDERGETLDNAITWQDRRSAETLPTLLGRLPPGHHAREDGSIAPGYLMASWHWLRQTDPERANRAKQISLPKDHLIHQFTGRHVTDPSDAAGTGLFDLTTGSWDASIAEAANLPLELLPEIIPAGTIVGPIKPDVARTLSLSEETHIIIAGGDAATAAFGAGVVRADQRLLVLSSGCQVIQPFQDDPGASGAGMFSWPAVAPAGSSQQLSVGTIVNGGQAIDWAQRLIWPGFPDDDPRQPASLASPAPRPPLFIPYLNSERAPMAAHGSSGAFFGLDARHTASQLVQAAVDGVTLSLLDIHMRMGGDIGTDTPIRVGGGGTLNEAWLNTIARLFARPLDVFCIPTLSGWGAARLAATTLGWIDPTQDPETWLPDITCVSPDGADAEVSRMRLDTFRRSASTAVELAREQDE